jgi:hypothetical protein
MAWHSIGLVIACLVRCSRRILMDATRPFSSLLLSFSSPSSISTDGTRSRRSQAQLFIGGTESGRLASTTPRAGSSSMQTTRLSTTARHPHLLPFHHGATMGRLRLVGVTGSKVYASHGSRPQLCVASGEPRLPRLVSADSMLIRQQYGDLWRAAIVGYRGPRIILESR